MAKNKAAAGVLAGSCVAIGAVGGAGYGYVKSWVDSGLNIITPETWKESNTKSAVSHLVTATICVGGAVFAVKNLPIFKAFISKKGFSGYGGDSDLLSRSRDLDHGGGGDFINNLKNVLKSGYDKVSALTQQKFGELQQALASVGLTIQMAEQQEGVQCAMTILPAKVVAASAESLLGVSELPHDS